jgi:hypothetical protein
MLLDLPEELLHSVFEALSPAARDTLRYTCHTLAKLGRFHEGVAYKAAAARACVLDELRRHVDGPEGGMTVDVATRVPRAIRNLWLRLLRTNHHVTVSDTLTEAQIILIFADAFITGPVGAIPVETDEA